MASWHIPPASQMHMACGMALRFREERRRQGGWPPSPHARNPHLGSRTRRSGLQLCQAALGSYQPCPQSSCQKHSRLLHIVSTGQESGWPPQLMARWASPTTAVR